MGADAQYRRTMGLLGLVVLLHVLALLSSPWLVPAIDLSQPVAARAAAVAEHPTMWRLAWLPWQAAAVANAAFALALTAYLFARGAATPRWWALGGAVAGIAAASFDLTGEMIYTTELPGLTGDVRLFADAERSAADLCSTRANLLYVGMSWCWLMAVLELRGGWRRHLELFALGLASFGGFLAFGAMNHRALGSLAEDGSAEAAGSMALAGGIGFVLYVPLLLGLAIELGRDHHGRHPAPDPGNAGFAWPKAGPLELPAALLSEPGLRDLVRPLLRLRPRLRSDVTDCVYVSWLVPAERVRPLLPDDLELDVERDGSAILTVLAYRHGGFGPERLGQLRPRLPSPRQVNVRLYLAPERKGLPRDAIWFLRTAVGSPALALGARLLSDGLPAQLPARLEHRRDGDGWWTSIEPGFGGAPDLRLRLAEARLPKPPKAWQRIHREWEDLVWHIVGVDRGVRVLNDADGRVETAISVRTSLDDVLPATIEEFSSDVLGPLVDGCPALAFVLPRVTFRVLGERVVRPRT